MGDLPAFTPGQSMNFLFYNARLFMYNNMSRRDKRRFNLNH